MSAMARAALGSLAGALLAALLAPHTKALFSPPTAGVGWATVNAYPKGWDYAVIGLLVLGAFLGAALATLRAPITPLSRQPPTANRQLATALAVAAAMFFLHDHPYAHMDHFHEGEHLTAGWLMKSGERPYKDFFIFHGLAVDAGLDAISLGDPPSPLRPRRLQVVLDALTIALLVPIAAELTATAVGMGVGVFLSMCAIAAFWLPVFPFFRMAPVLLATWALLRYARNGSMLALFGALASGTLGVLWSLDTGTYALAGTIGALLCLRKPPLKKAALVVAVAFALPLVVLLAVRADIRQFLVDSYIWLPKAIDATWALAAPHKITAESLRYFLPPVFYGFLGALALLAWRRGDKALASRLVIVTIFSLLFFRTAVGRVGWSHTRFALPLLGIALVAFVLEPLARTKRGAIAAALLAIPLFFHLEVRENVVAGFKLVREWPARQQHAGLVPYPFATGRGLYTSEPNAIDLGSLANFIDSLGPREATILDVSNERALYYFLQRKPPIRVMEISMLSVPELLSEAMAQLNANPPLCVIVKGYDEIAAFDGVPNDVRVPELARWIESNYPRRTQIGRFVVAHK